MAFLFSDCRVLPEEAHPGRLGFSLAEAAKALFQSVVEKSRIDKELTLEELNAFKYRFVAGMMGMEDSAGPKDILQHQSGRGPGVEFFRCIFDPWTPAGLAWVHILGPRR